MSDRIANYETIEAIKNLIVTFENGTLPRSHWRHHAHLILGLWYLTQYPDSEAINEMCDRIQSYNRAARIPRSQNSGYHETITLFWMQKIQQYLKSVPSDRSFIELTQGLLGCYPTSFLIWEYYSRDRLMSWDARLSWLEPDLKPIES